MSRLPAILALVFVPALLATAGCGSASPAADDSALPSPPSTAPPVVKRVDHVVISSQDPAALFKLFTGPLGLAVAWPYSKYPGFSTGGVHAGNVNIESLSFGPPATTSTPGAIYYGIVLEPYPLARSVPELKARGALPGKAEVTMTEVGGRQVPAWTNVTLKALCGPEYVVYLCAYTPQMKAALEGRETTGPQGPLGIVSVEKIVIASKDAATLRGTWSTTMAPDTMSAAGEARHGRRPGHPGRPGRRGVDHVAGLQGGLARDGEERAHGYLGLLGEATTTQLTLDPAKVQGLRMVVVQQ